MQTFIALFLAPASIIEEWMKTPQDVREQAEKKMREDWDVWTNAHRTMIKETHAGGKTKKVSATGITDTKNDIMLYSIIEAESHEAATAVFANHPHLGIPEATIEVMSIRSM